MTKLENHSIEKYDERLNNLLTKLEEYNFLANAENQFKNIYTKFEKLIQPVTVTVTNNALLFIRKLANSQSWIVITMIQITLVLSFILGITNLI